MMMWLDSFSRHFCFVNSFASINKHKHKNTNTNCSCSTAPKMLLFSSALLLQLPLKILLLQSSCSNSLSSDQRNPRPTPIQQILLSKKIIFFKDKDNDNSAVCQRRRQALSCIAASILPTVVPRTESADAAMIDDGGSPLSNRPRAPLSALVPAIQQKLLLEQCLDISKQLLATATTAADTTSALNLEHNNVLFSQLQSIIPPPPEDQNIKTMRMNTPQKQQQHLSGPTVRAACNVYTSQLRFADSYVFTADKETKSTLIRRDGGVPSVKQVIISDLDLRDLYRNEWQTLVDDIQAELYHDRDVVELNSLLTRAMQASKHWFELISPQDVTEAREAIILG
jgi:hypothetical protein